METLIYTNPVLLVSSVEKTLVPKVEYLKDGVGLSEEEICGMVRRFPSLLTFSVENNLKHKYEFFVGEMEGSFLIILGLAWRIESNLGPIIAYNVQA
ncbi:Transcription termination factor MTEF1, chloroplastic [Linum grandiflorum]